MHNNIYLCVCVCVCVCMLFQNCILLDCRISLCICSKIFWFINNTHRLLFAWRHLEARQYVAQSGLHLHQSEPHSCKENEKSSCQELRNASGFTSHWANRQLHVIKFIRGIITDMIISTDPRKSNSLTSGI